jgi:EAL domain-containing protein (putative c-di-GMP-specific phosphodiesterase class I)
MTVAEARRRWPEVILWINFPSPVHLEPPEAIRRCVREILGAAAPGQRFLFGITEDIPDGVWQVSLPEISAALQEYGALPISIA